MRAELLFLLFQVDAALPAISAPPDDLLFGLDIAQILCPEDPDRIVICGSREQERSEYRLPDKRGTWTPESGVRSVDGERNALLDAGRSGSGSLYRDGITTSGPFACGPVGPGGYSGCHMSRHLDNAFQNNE